jgi:hypothetical protein
MSVAAPPCAGTEIRSTATPAPRDHLESARLGGTAHGDETVSVRGPRHVLIRRTLGEERHRLLRPVGAHLVHAPALALPGDIADPVPIGDPRRLRLDHVGAREPLRLPVRQVDDVEVIERREGEALSVRRRRDVADLVSVELGAVADRVLEGDLGPSSIVACTRKATAIGAARRSGTRQIFPP